MNRHAHKMRANILPRFIRLRDAPAYLGMDKNRFNAEVRPHLTEIRIGKQGRAFDRLDLDNFAEEYKGRNGVPAAQPKKRKESWVHNERQVSPNVVASGTQISSSEEKEFAEALARAISPRPKHT